MGGSEALVRVSTPIVGSEDEAFPARGEHLRGRGAKRIAGADRLLFRADFIEVAADDASRRR